MEEIRQAALAYYSNLTNKQKEVVMKFFRDMDADGDGKISMSEYMTYLNSKGAGIISHPGIFKEFDKDSSGTLDFEEAITFFYMYATRRILICDGCGDFLKGLYFTCIQCFQTQSYDLCCTCFRNGNFTHHKDAIFYDNFALLRSKSLISLRTSSFKNKAKKFLKELDEGLDGLITGMNMEDNSSDPTGKDTGICSIM